VQARTIGAAAIIVDSAIDVASNVDQLIPRILAKFCLQSIVSLRKCAAQPWSGLLFIIV
jgi:hypothetical protein